LKNDLLRPALNDQIMPVKPGRRFQIILVTAPDLKCARKLAKAALHSRLVACANLIPKLESHYRWQGKLERSAEVLIVFKTTRQRTAALERLILEEHPYDTPEFITLPILAGTAKYLSWIMASTR
jgi:periplasmic divalent cation tolerance protein